MNRRKVVVFIHPKGTGVRIPAAEGSRNIGTGELPFDTTRAIFNVLSQRTVERFPDIRFIWAHAGGTSLFLLSRFAWSQSGQGGQEEFRATYARLSKVMSTFYYDLALTVSLSTMKAILEVTSPSHLVLGSDIPYSGDARRSIGQVFGELPHVGLTPDQIAGAVRRNAESLFPRFRG